MFSRQQQMFPQTATKVPQGNRWVGSTNGWSDGSNGWYWPTHPCSIIFRIFFPFANPKPDKNPMLSCSKKIWFKSNQFSSQFFGKTTDLYNFNEFPNKNFLWVLCLENPPYFFATPPRFFNKNRRSNRSLRKFFATDPCWAYSMPWRYADDAPELQWLQGFPGQSPGAPSRKKGQNQGDLKTVALFQNEP